MCPDLLVDQRRMADAEAEKEPGSVLAGELRVGRGDVGRFVHPHVEDAGGDDRLLGGAEQVAHGIEHRTADVGDPECGETELVELCGGLRGLPGVSVT